MQFITRPEIVHLLGSYGYLAVFLLVCLESMGIPLPGEAVLITASIYAGTTHHLNGVLVILAASLGAVIGDNIGYAIGYYGGYKLLNRYGRFIKIRKQELLLGQYLFMKHGGKIVFFGRFISYLRIFAALLAGSNRMHWKKFFLYNALGGIVWAAIYGTGGYFLGKEIHRISGTFRIFTFVAGMIIMVLTYIYIQKNLKRLEKKAAEVMEAQANEK